MGDILKEADLISSSPISKSQTWMIEHDGDLYLLYECEIGDQPDCKMSLKSFVDMMFRKEAEASLNGLIVSRRLRAVTDDVLSPPLNQRTYKIEYDPMDHELRVADTSTVENLRVKALWEGLQKDQIRRRSEKIMNAATISGWGEW